MVDECEPYQCLQRFTLYLEFYLGIHATRIAAFWRLIGLKHICVGPFRRGPYHKGPYRRGLIAGGFIAGGLIAGFFVPCVVRIRAFGRGRMRLASHHLPSCPTCFCTLYVVLFFLFVGFCLVDDAVDCRPHRGLDYYLASGGAWGAPVD